MNEGDLPAATRLLLAGLIVFGLLLAGVLFVFWGFYVLPVMAVIGGAVLLVRWLRAGTQD